MSRTPEEEVAEKVASGKHDCQFTREELSALQDVARVYLGLQQFGRLAALVQRIAKYVWWLAVIFLSFKLGVVEFIRSAIGAK